MIECWVREEDSVPLVVQSDGCCLCKMAWCISGNHKTSMYWSCVHRVHWLPSTRSLIGFWHELRRGAASQLKANQRFIKQAILYFIGSCELEAPQYYTQAWHCSPHHTPLILAFPCVPLATNNTPHNIRGSNAVPHAPSIRGRLRSCVPRWWCSHQAEKLSRCEDTEDKARPMTPVRGKMSARDTFLSPDLMTPVVIISGNTTAPHSFSAFIELQRTRDMINFTAVMRYPGFCGGGVQTRNVNYCMAPGLGIRGPLSQSEARDGARDQSEARDCAWEDGHWAVGADRR